MPRFQLIASLPVGSKPRSLLHAASHAFLVTLLKVCGNAIFALSSAANVMPIRFPGGGPTRWLLIPLSLQLAIHSAAGWHRSPRSAISAPPFLRAWGYSGLLQMGCV